MISMLLGAISISHDRFSTRLIIFIDVKVNYFEQSRLKRFSQIYSLIASAINIDRLSFDTLVKESFTIAKQFTIRLLIEDFHCFTGTFKCYTLSFEMLHGICNDAYTNEKYNSIRARRLNN